MPILFLIIPMIMQKKINFKLSFRDALFGFISSISILSMFIPIFLAIRGSFEITLPTAEFIFITIIAIALPEEAFFRGFLLHNFGCNLKGIFISSLLFAIAHSHRFFLYGDYLALATFFPSLIMGFLYVKTVNILPSIIFHSMSNIIMFMVM
ncbi:MAG: CPBP family intramembrane metalloprotease [Thermodesulfovibrionales bacterium]|nr:CPBP family intramembrane metalloprotease [Thermodesulfovibrionales bacterium]